MDVCCFIQEEKKKIVECISSLCCIHTYINMHIPQPIPVRQRL